MMQPKIRVRSIWKINKHMGNGRNKVVFPSKRSKSFEKVRFVGLNLGKRFLQ